MFAYLKGNFESLTPTQLVIDVQGVGYMVNISFNTYSKIQNLKEGKLYIYQHIREDTNMLFGFYSIEEKEIFLLLMTVSGISTNTSRMILSSLSPNEVVSIISRGDVMTFQSIKGIGKKTAERAVLELKDKIYKLSSKETISNEGGFNAISSDAIKALMALGIQRGIADKAIQKVLSLSTSEQPLENIIKEALKYV